MNSKKKDEIWDKFTTNRKRARCTQCKKNVTADLFTGPICPLCHEGWIFSKDIKTQWINTERDVVEREKDILKSEKKTIRWLLWSREYISQDFYQVRRQEPVCESSHHHSCHDTWSK